MGGFPGNLAKKVIFEYDFLETTMELEYLRNLSRLDLELQKDLQLKVLEFTVVFENLLIKEKGERYVEKTRNQSLDKLNFINQLLKDLPDDDPRTT